jgi:hypothetical protein
VRRPDVEPTIEAGEDVASLPDGVETPLRLVHILGITDDAKCFEMVRRLRWPEGTRCPHGDSAQVVKQGRDDIESQRQRYERRAWGRRYDDLTDTIFAGHHQPLRIWVLVLYFMGLNLSHERWCPGLIVNRP